MAKKTPQFYPLTTEEFLKVNGLLKDSELRLWIYLSTVLPFEDSSADFKTADVAKLLGVSQRTVQRAMNRLIQLDLFDVEILSAKIRRRQFTPLDRQIAPEASDNLRQPSDKSRQGRDILRHLMEPPVAIEGYNDYTEGVPDLSRLKTIQTTDLCIEESNFQDTQNSNSENLEEPSNSQNPVKSSEIVNVSTVKTKSGSEDQYSGGALTRTSIKYDSALGIRPPAPKVKYLIPEGDWLNNDGKLDAGFIRHIAKQWQESQNASFHKMSIEEVEALVFSHFARDHAALAVKWEAYARVETRHAQNTKLALDSGISIPLEQQQRVVNAANAIASNFRNADPVIEHPQPLLTVGSEHTENRDAYRLMESEPISEEEQRENLRKLASLGFTAIRRMPAVEKQRKATKVWPENLFEANAWLSDPALKPQALLWAKREGFSFDGTEIYQEEF